jgi:hypothetical protein
MKTALSLLLLPIMVFSQPQNLSLEEQMNIELAMGFDIESILKSKIDIPKDLDETIDLLITIEVYFEELVFDAVPPQLKINEDMVYVLPQYLGTLSLTALSYIENEHPQKRLNNSLAQTDAMFPKENTLLSWLNPVRYESNTWDAVENMPEGFGPRIRL